MITHTRTADPKTNLTRFELPSSIWADRIFVVGIVDQQEILRHSMKQTRDGTWHLAIAVPADREIEFRYLVGDQWTTDGNIREVKL